ncbi:MAG: hypothetical protein AABX74_06545 [Nanoarchaeota archaeon]
MPKSLKKNGKDEISNTVLFNEIKNLTKTNEEQAKTNSKLVNMLAEIKKKQEDMEESLSIFKYGHEAIKQRHIEEYKKSGRLHEIDFQHKMLVYLRNDKSLNRAEKEVFEFMTKLFDDVNHKFGEITYNKLEKQAPVGKRNLPKVLKSLVNKGKIARRSDGYHTYYKANYKAYEENKGRQLEKITKPENVLEGIEAID